MNAKEFKMTKEKRQIQWQRLVELIVVLMTILGSKIQLYLHTDSKLEASISQLVTRLRS